MESAIDQSKCLESVLAIIVPGISASQSAIQIHAGGKRKRKPVLFLILCIFPLIELDFHFLSQA